MVSHPFAGEDAKRVARGEAVEINLDRDHRVRYELRSY